MKISWENLSQFDGKSPKKGKCNYCGLNYHEEMEGGIIEVQIEEGRSEYREYCKPCKRLFNISQFSNLIGRLTLPALITGLMIYFIDAFAEFTYLLYPIGAVVVLPILISAFLFKYLMYFRIDEKQLLTHRLRMIKKRSDISFYETVLSYLKEKGIPNHQMVKLLKSELVNSVLFLHKNNPPNVIEDWAELYAQTPENFIADLIENHDLLEGLEAKGGVGLLPDIFSKLEDNKLIFQVMDKLEEACNELDEVGETERKYFLEDLFLVEEEILDLVEEHDKWHFVMDTLDEFEPDEVPQGIMEQFAKKADERAMAMEYEKKVTSEQKSNNQRQLE